MWFTVSIDLDQSYQTDRAVIITSNAFVSRV
jgi:hypothetical protein